MPLFSLEAPTEVKLTSVTPRGCRVPDCGRRSRWRGLCCTHYERWLATGAEGGPIKLQAPNGAGYRTARGYVVLDVDGRKNYEHIVIAERALGHALPPGAEVHHIDEDKTNNAPTNLVVCPSAAYHKLLHQRQRAFDACGHYDWRRCNICKRYDSPQGLWISRKNAAHRACMAAEKRNRKERKQPACSL